MGLVIQDQHSILSYYLNVIGKGIEIDENSHTGGVVISYVSPKSMPYNLKKGDIILSVDGKEISSIDSLLRIFDRHGFRLSRITVSRESRVLDIKMND